MAHDDEEREKRPEIDLKSSRRLIRFLNAARRPRDLMFAPDQIEVAHEAVERAHLPERPKAEPLFDRELATRIIDARDEISPAYGFHNLDQVFEVDRRLWELFRRFVWRFGRAVYGQWDLLYDMEAGDVEVESEHAALLHTYEVIFLSSGTDTFLWDPSDEAAPRFRQLQAADTGLAANLMCCGHSFLSDGKLLAVGGGGAGAGQATSVEAWKFDPVAETWQKTASDMAIKRWYPTVVTLGDELGPTGRSGRVLVASGDPGAATATLIEVYSEASDTFEPVTVTGPVNQKFPQTYPGLHLLPGGEIFYAPVGFGNCSTSSVYSLSDPAAYFAFAGSASGSWTNVGGAMNRTKGMSVQLMQPTYPYVRVMVVGGGDTGTSKTVQLANLSTLSPSWGSPISIPDSEPRVNVNVVVLPDETVFISGGTQTASPASWIYNPSATVSPWSEMDELNVPRHYHSMALLLPSGKVMAAGGSKPGGCGHSMNNSIEVFSPPYLFNSDGSLADRPEIARVNGEVPRKSHAPVVHHGSAFTIETPDAAEIDRVVLVRPMAVTHQTDTEQKVIRCTFSKTADDTITATTPDGSHPHSVAPRGYYMLFVLNVQGVPSEGKFVHLH